MLATWGLLMEQLLLGSVCRKAPLNGVLPVRGGCSGVSPDPAPGEEDLHRGWVIMARDLCMPKPTPGVVHDHLVFKHRCKQPDNSLQVFCEWFRAAVSHGWRKENVRLWTVLPGLHVSGQGRVVVILVVILVVLSLTPHPGATGKGLRL